MNTTRLQKIQHHLQSINISKRAITRLIAGKTINRSRYSKSQNKLIDLLYELIDKTEKTIAVKMVHLMRKKKLIRK